MLKIVKNDGQRSPQNSRHGRQSHDVRRVTLPADMLTKEQILDAALENASVDARCAALIETLDSAHQFGLKLAAFFTDAFPSANSAYPNALCEILNSATISYSRVSASAAHDPRDQLATFLAAGVNCAVGALVCYSASQTRNGNVEFWEPWEHGPLATWVEWGGEPLQFESEYAPSIELRYATRTMLAQKLLRFHDMQSIARAGIDLQSLDLF